MEIIHDPVPSDLQRLYDGTNWEEYMEGVFKFVAAEGGTYDIIAGKIKLLKATQGQSKFNSPGRVVKMAKSRLDFQECHSCCTKS